MLDFKRKIGLYMKKHESIKRRGIAAVVLSLLVAVSVAASLIMPAISLSSENNNVVTLADGAIDVDEAIGSGHYFEPNIKDVTVVSSSDTDDSEVKHVIFNLGYSLEVDDVSINDPYQPYI